MKYIIRLLLPAFACVLWLASCSKTDGLAANESATGTGGSLARFIIAGSHLYVIDGTQLYTYSLGNPSAPRQVNEQQIGFDIETIYTWKDKLFIGSQAAMYIYSIADPSIPKLLGSASHLRACDPVVANDSVAYVTVRTGTNCGGNTNALYVYSLHNILQPVQTNALPLDNPHGLGLKDKTLYVCDGASGLRVFDLASAYNPVQVTQVLGEVFMDCIPYNDLLICMLSDGMSLYDIRDPFQPLLLSVIKN